MQKRKTNIYLISSSKSNCFNGYIGKADNPEKRLIKHLSRARKGSKYYVHNWLRKVQREGFEPILKIQHWDVPIDKWEELERQTIRLYKAIGWKLKNMTVGGDGAQNGNKYALNHKHTEDARKKMRISRAKQIISHTPETRRKIGKFHEGKKCSPETRRRMSESAKGKNNGMFGKTHSPETRRRMSESVKGKNNGMFGKSVPPETRRKIFEMKRKLNDQQVRVIRAFKELENSLTQKEIGKFFGVSFQGISKIQNYKSYII